MPDTHIISETPIGIHTLRKELDRIKKSDKELNFRANRTEEYIQQVLIHKNADELFEKISKLNISRLKEQHIHKILDVLPATMNELKAVLQSYTLTVNNESMKKIIDTISEFLEKK